MGQVQVGVDVRGKVQGRSSFERVLEVTTVVAVVLVATLILLALGNVRFSSPAPEAPPKPVKVEKTDPPKDKAETVTDASKS